MLKPKILPAILVVAPAAMVLTAHTSRSEPQAQECRASFGSSTPQGSHWYYRINRADKHRCWYLSAVNARSHEQRATSVIPRPALTPRKRSAREATPAAQPQASPAKNVSWQVAPGQEASAEIAFLQSSPAEHDGRLQPSLAARDGRMAFVARWPENLPNARDLEQSEPAPTSNSYADASAETNATEQMPLRWPVIEASHAAQISAIEPALRSFSIAGGVLTGALLLVGWAAKFDRRPDRWQIPNRWRAIAARVNLRRRSDFAAMAGCAPASGTLKGNHTRRPATLTDPAHDLKTSLAELMRDLKRAGPAIDATRSFEPPVQPAKVHQKLSKYGDRDRHHYSFEAVRARSVQFGKLERARERA